VGESQKGVTGENLLRLLELRSTTSSTVWLRRLAARVAADGGARHFQVNGRKVTVPSFLAKVGDVVQLRPPPRWARAWTTTPTPARADPAVARRGCERQAGDVGAAAREDIQIPCPEQLIVELYSK
jgi:small subunit ribosomal protein S4